MVPSSVPREMNVDLYPRGNDFLARLRTSGDSELEVWAANRHVAPLERVLGAAIRFEVASGDFKDQPPAHPQPAADTARGPGKAGRPRRHKRAAKEAAGTAGEGA